METTSYSGDSTLSNLNPGTTLGVNVNKEKNLNYSQKLKCYNIWNYFIGQLMGTTKGSKFDARSYPLYKQLFKILLRTAMLCMWFDFKIILLQSMFYIKMSEKIYKSLICTGSNILHCPDVSIKLILLWLFFLRWAMWPMGFLFTFCFQ